LENPLRERERRVKHDKKGGDESMSGVTLKDGESFDSLVKRFRKIVSRDGLLQDVKKFQYYEKPSERKKKKAIASRRRTTRRTREL
jgi:small subunit ribosomal protein S21